MNRLGCYLVLAAGLLLGGCSFAPEYQRPVLDTPATWEDPSADALKIQWWRHFDDEILNTLIAEALVHNRDVEMAMARVDQARSVLGLARADQFPTPLIQGQGQEGRSFNSFSQTAVRGSQHQLAGLASWEIDLWGRYRNASNAAIAQLIASEAAREGILLAVAGQTASAYFQMMSFDLQTQIAQQTVTSREEAVRIYKARFDQGLINELDFLRAKTEVEIARSTLYSTLADRDAAVSALSVLLGRSPLAIMNDKVIKGPNLENKMPPVPILPSGLPSDLLERRPDIRQAEELLKASNFNIGVAKAAYFPTISLTGTLGYGHPDLSSLFTTPAQMWNYGGGVTLPLDIWRTDAQVKGAEANKRLAVAQYEKSVQTAFRELRDALTQQKQLAEVVRSMSVMVRDLRKAVELARARYDNGYSAYLEVLDAERSLFDAEINLANSKSAHLNSVVKVCMALGGGWKE